MTDYRKLLVASFFPCIACAASAQVDGEMHESTPEQRDAAFSSEDAAREAAAWSNEIITQDASGPLHAMAQASDLVFRGEVVSKEVVYDAANLPFTHTTFRISEVLAGQFDDNKITLVEEGGPAWNDPESVVIVSDSRHYALGEEEILFLDIQPEAEHRQEQVAVRHRFKVHNGKVFGEDGHGLIFLPGNGEAVYRPVWSRNRNPAKRFSEIQIGSHVLTRVYDDEPSNTDSDSRGQAQAGRAQPGYQSSVDVSTFTAAIANQQEADHE